MGDGQWVIGFASMLLLSQLLVSATVYESPNEIFADGDFDGDGRADLVIVDKTTGDYRLAYQLSGGDYTWAKARASGIDNVSGLAVGKLLNTTADALALTGPAANRLNVFD